MRITRYSKGYNYRHVSKLRCIYRGEGGSIYVGRIAGVVCLISDEGTLADFLPADDELICVREFDSSAERKDWLNSAYPHLNVP
jgi:hypothetical protein